jgi:hypothetical protein
MIRFDEWLPVSAEHLWSILGTVDRVDWVPGVTACELDGSVRRLHLPGAGDIAEEIKVRDEAQFRLVYQCIESPQPMDFHEARIQIIPDSGDRCRLIWEADIRPEQFEPFLKGSMEGALAQLREVAVSSAGQA